MTRFSRISCYICVRERAGLSWQHWDDLVIAAQMERLDIKEIYPNDKDFEKILGLRKSSKFSLEVARARSDPGAPNPAPHSGAVLD